MRNKEWYLDSLIKGAIEQELADTPEPPLTQSEAWEQIHKQLRKSDNRTANSVFLRTRLGKVSFAASLVLIIVLISSLASNENYAFGWISKYFKQVQGDVTQLFFARKEPVSSLNGHRPPPPPSMDEIKSKIEIHHVEQRQVKLSLSEAQKKSKFTIMVPEAVPRRYSLQHVNVTLVEDKKSTELELLYTSDADEFVIKQRLFEGQFSYTMGVDNEDTTVKDVMIDDNEGTFLLFKDGSTRLMWVNSNLQLIIDGFLSEDELLEMARSM